MNPALEATLWGLLSGGALLIGALAGYYLHLGQRIIAGVMAFGSGVLISVLCFDLMDKAFESGGIVASSLGFIGGALIFTGANEILAKFGARHRKRSRQQAQQEGDGEEGSGLAIALGALLDGIPESIVIGLSLLSGTGVSLVAVIGIFISNLPEGLSSATGLKRKGKSKIYIFGLWSGIALISALSAFAGYYFFGDFSPQVIAACTALAAGAMLAMIIDTMIPEAFHETHQAAGLIGVSGFLVAFYLSKAMG